MTAVLSTYLFSVLAGYIFVTKNSYFYQHRSWNDKTETFMEATIIGLVFLLLSNFSLLLLKLWTIPHLCPIPTFSSYWLSVRLGIVDIWNFIVEAIPYKDIQVSEATQSKQSASFIASQKEAALFSIMLSYIFVLLSKFSSNSPPDSKVRKKRGTELDIILGKAQEAGHMIMVTLKNRKVYIGTIEELPPLLGSNKNERKYIKLSVMRSGFRDSENLKIEGMTNYGSVIMTARVLYRRNVHKKEPHKKITISNVEIPFQKMETTYKNGMLIDADEILSARLWDKQVYDAYKIFEDAATAAAAIATSTPSKKSSIKPKTTKKKRASKK